MACGRNAARRALALAAALVASGCAVDGGGRLSTEDAARAAERDIARALDGRGG